MKRTKADFNSKRSRIRQYTDWLVSTYPKAFNEKRPSPLVVGVFEALLEDPHRPSWASRGVVQSVLANWTRRTEYRKALVVYKKPRRNLAGEKLAPPTPEEANQTANVWNAEREAKRRKRRYGNSRSTRGARRGAKEAKYPCRPPGGDIVKPHQRVKKQGLKVSLGDEVADAGLTQEAGGRG